MFISAILTALVCVTWAHANHKPLRAHGQLLNEDIFKARLKGLQASGKDVRKRYNSNGPIRAKRGASATVTTSAAQTTTSVTCLCANPVAAWGQCGGIGYTGSTCCVAGQTCTVGNPYYSQCLSGSPTTCQGVASTMTVTLSPTTTSATSTTTSVRAVVTTAQVCSCAQPVAAWGQCGGIGYTGSTCCVAGQTCTFGNPYYSQCLSGSPTTCQGTLIASTYTVTPTSTLVSSAATTTQVTTTTTSASSSAQGTCNVIDPAGGSGSDGCTPYTVTGSGVTFPLGSTAQNNNGINYQAISCSAYKSCLGNYSKKPSSWAPQSFNVHFEALNNQPGGRYIGSNYVDFGNQGIYTPSAYSAFSGSYCIIWVQVDGYNQHFGEGHQYPACYNCS